MVTEDGAVQRLGKAELGRHAFEERMPIWLEKHLRTKDHRTSKNLIPAIAHLCENDQTVEAAYLCHPAVSYISKTRREGPFFCGYHNIRMLISHIQGAKSQGHEHFPSDGQLPNILALQDLIEDAWDSDISTGREEIGRLRLTRKYIGTQEAQSLFRFLKIPCRAGVHRTKAAKAEAWELLLDAVEGYFREIPEAPSPVPAPAGKVVQTLLPPIYLQRPLHSLTIIGVERRVKKDGSHSRNLLVFDPAYRPRRAVDKMAKGVEEKNPDRSSFRRSKRLLRPYRRGPRELNRYKEFETLMLVA